MTIPKPIEPDANAGLVDDLLNVDWPPFVVERNRRRAAALIQQLTAELETARKANDKLARQIVDDIERAEAAEKERDMWREWFADAFERQMSLIQRIAELEAQYQQASEALERIVERSRNFELGTSKVVDMRNLASAALKGKP